MLTRLRDRTAFRWRIAPILTVTMILVTVTFITTITLLDISRTRRIYWDELQNRGWLLAGQMNIQLADPLYLENVEDVEKIASIVGSQPDIEYVHVFTPEGTLLSDSSANGFGSLGTSAHDLGQRALAEQRGLEDINTGVMEIAQPVTIGDRVIGGLQIGLRSDTLQTQIRAIVVEHVLQGVFLTAIAAGIAYLIARQFSRPVQSLVAATDSMAAGRLDTRVRDVRGGELGELAGSFNTMAGELQTTIHDLQASRHRIVGVQEGVRRDIAAHLHGHVQARLLVLRTQLYRALKTPEATPDTARHLTDVIDQLDDLIQRDISALSRRLYPSILRRGLIPALQSLTDQFESSLAVKLNVDSRVAQIERMDRNAIPESVKLAGYRIVEDALTNVVKHANATTAVIRLDFPDNHSLRLSVEDDGDGFDIDGSVRGLGLEAMLDYAGAVGGSCDVWSVIGMGSVITTNLPIGNRREDSA